MFEIKVGFLVSYDYELIYNSLPLIYKQADKIVLAIDKDRLTWSGISYEIDPSFFEWLENYDAENKITIYEDNFYVSKLSTSACDTRERNMLAQQLGQGGWHIQVDSDEYFIDFENFIKKLRLLESKKADKPLQVYTRFITLFKKLERGYLVVDRNFENIATATNHPTYFYIRNVKDTHKIYFNNYVAHQSWARPVDELALKLKSWGHNADFNTDSYLKLWKALDMDNYKFISEFHPLTPKFWPRLTFIQSDTVKELLSEIKYHIENNPPPRRANWMIRNFIPPIINKLINLKKI